jgi:EamA domain-containing membrane protein RarD
MLGMGIGLLLASKLKKGQRQAVGWSLVMVGVITTIPLAMNLFGREEEQPAAPRSAA